MTSFGRPNLSTLLALIRPRWNSPSELHPPPLDYLRPPSAATGDFAPQTRREQSTNTPSERWSAREQGALRRDQQGALLGGGHGASADDATQRSVPFTTRVIDDVLKYALVRNRLQAVSFVPQVAPLPPPPPTPTKLSRRSGGEGNTTTFRPSGGHGEKTLPPPPAPAGGARGRGWWGGTEEEEVIVSCPRSLPPLAKRPQLPRRLRRSSSSTSSSSHLRQRLVLLSLLSLVLCSVAMEAEDGPVTSLESCMQKYSHFEIPDGDVYCQWAWDTVLCWPPTRAGLTAKQRCPRFKGIDPTKFAIKRCGVNGRWEGKTPGLGGSHADDIAAGAEGIDHGGSLGDGGGIGSGDGGVSLGSSGHGWTNYTPCFTPEMRQLLEKLYSGSQDEAEVKFRIAERTRTLEIVGLGVSLAALLVSLAIFCHFRSLKNNRTRIHKNLFVAMVIQVVIRLTLYIDQAVIRTGAGDDSSVPTASVAAAGMRRYRQGIDNTPILCEASYVFLEYARTAMFMWMFIEGLYLHNMITVTVFQEKSYYSVYTLVGWGVPVLMTAAWALTTAIHYGTSRCWWGYNLTLYFWILEGPRLGVILLNFLFLLNIIRVLVVKLRQSHTSEIEQVRKAVRAALVLLPLLGITNVVNMADAPLDRAAWEFALWSYGTHFLTSFQGLFIAFLYCFLNGEVRTAVGKSVSVYLSIRRDIFGAQQRRNSAFSSVFVADRGGGEDGDAGGGGDNRGGESEGGSG
ncbi:PDF receptor, partial [Ischnura elegans]|uniref:PDF receptor n=1 Tax=Ischnura elegans TaxID=197161 RepID=UPI001ED8B15A